MQSTLRTVFLFVLCFFLAACPVFGPYDNMYDSKVAVPAPTFSIAEGTYQVKFSLNLFCAYPGAEIRYSTNRNNPGITSAKYVSAIDIGGVGALVDIKAIAFFDGKPSSEVSDASYRLDQNIVTIAGDGSAGYSGDGGLAVNARVRNPMGIACDGNGNVYIADSGNNCIRKIDRTTGQIETFNTGLGRSNNISVNGNTLYCVKDDGIAAINLSTKAVSIIAGGNSNGFSGDGGLATAAQLNGPEGVVSDGNGIVYIADSSNNRIRKIDAAGIITTIAGSGNNGFSGDGGPAASAQMSHPSGLALDGDGNLLIADPGNCMIRKMDLTTGIMSTICGAGTVGAMTPTGVPAADFCSLGMCYSIARTASGDLYIISEQNGLFIIDHATGMVRNLVASGSGYAGDDIPLSGAQTNGARGVAAESSGNVYIADTQNNRIRKIEN